MPPRRTKQELIEDEVEDDIVDDEDDEDEDGDEESGAVFESSEILRECHWQRRTVGDLVGMCPPFFSPTAQTQTNWADLFFYFFARVYRYDGDTVFRTESRLSERCGLEYR